MDIVLRFLVTLVNFLGFLLEPLICLCSGARKEQLPPARNPLLQLAAVDLIAKIRKREITSEAIVRAYIERIQEVEPYLNAVVEERFDEAIADAKRADEILKNTPSAQLSAVYKRYPMLGIPFTVKESCGVKDMSHEVGNINRVGLKSPNNGAVVELLRASGCIPLLVSANPEFCLSWETTSELRGHTNNPFDTRRTCGGSSGGEGALNGAGASLFGVGSDIAGSIRLPAFYNGVFGHKPTGGVVSVKGHFPYTSDENFGRLLQLGPITRFAKDLPLLLAVMAGPNADKLRFTETFETKDIKIFYLEDNGFTLTHSSVDYSVRLSILQAVNFFKRNGLSTLNASGKLRHLSNALEISVASLVRLQNLPRILTSGKGQPDDNVHKEILKYLIGRGKYSIQALFVEAVLQMNGFMTNRSLAHWAANVEDLKHELMDMLGDDGVLFFPTSNIPALHHNMSVFNISAVSFVGIVNALGLPATHVPMGLDKNGLPTGFQVIAAPYRDKLCLQVAGELEAAFGGWKSPY